MIRRPQYRPSRRPTYGPELMAFSLNLAVETQSLPWMREPSHMRLGVRAAIWDRDLLCIYVFAPSSTVPIQLYVTPKQAQELHDSIAYTLERMDVDAESDYSE